MQETVITAAETVCCAAQENDQLTSAAFLFAAHFMHSRIKADLQAITQSDKKLTADQILFSHSDRFQFFMRKKHMSHAEILNDFI